MDEPAAAPESAKKSSPLKWVIILLALILAVLAWPYCSDIMAETSCTGDGGRVMVHNLSGRRLCDFPPYGEGIFDMDDRDYWMD